MKKALIRIVAATCLVASLAGCVVVPVGHPYYGPPERVVYWR